MNSEARKMVLFLSFIYRDNVTQKKCHFAWVLSYLLSSLKSVKIAKTAKPSKVRLQQNPKTSKPQPLCFYYFRLRAVVWEEKWAKIPWVYKLLIFFFFSQPWFWFHPRICSLILDWNFDLLLGGLFLKWKFYFLKWKF